MWNKPFVEQLKVLVVIAFVVVLVWLAKPTPVLFVVGLAMAILGEAIRVWAAGHLRRNQQLITSGPYAHCRHPLYLGRFLLLPGICLMCGYWYLALPALAILAAYSMSRKVRREEERLRGLFGEATFDAWAKNVPRIFPRLTPFRLNPQPWSLRVVIENNHEHWTVLAELVLLAVLLWRLLG